MARPSHTERLSVGSEPSADDDPSGIRCSTVDLPGQLSRADMPVQGSRQRRSQASSVKLNEREAKLFHFLRVTIMRRPILESVSEEGRTRPPLPPPPICGKGRTPSAACDGSPP